MSNVISKEELVNFARLRAQLPILESIDDTSNSDVRTSLLLLKEVEDRVLRMFPWSHASKRVELEASPEGGDISYEYNFRYKLPTDYAFIWQLYAEGGLDSELYGQFFANISYAYYSGSFIGGTFKVQDLGEIIGQEFHANASPIYCLYTARGVVDYTKADPQFMDVMKSELTKRFVDIRGLPVEEYVAVSRSLDKDSREARKLASVQNRQAHSVGESRIVEVVGRSLRGRRGY